MPDFELNTAWDVDKAAESLNTSLFGNSKSQKRKKSKHKSETTKFKQPKLTEKPTDVDKQLSKNAKKKLKDKKRKLKKEAAILNSTKNSQQNGSSSEAANKKTNMSNNNSLLDNASDKKKVKRKNKKQKDSLSVSKDGSATLANGQPKAQKRKRDQSVGSGAPNVQVKKMKMDKTDTSADHITESGTADEQKRKKNRKKKNTSKKNREKHLALKNKIKPLLAIINKDINALKAATDSVGSTDLNKVLQKQHPKKVKLLQSETEKKSVHAKSDSLQLSKISKKKKKNSTANNNADAEIFANTSSNSVESQIVKKVKPEKILNTEFNNQLSSEGNKLNSKKETKEIKKLKLLKAMLDNNLDVDVVSKSTSNKQPDFDSKLSDSKQKKKEKRKRKQMEKKKKFKDNQEIEGQNSTKSTSSDLENYSSVQPLWADSSLETNARDKLKSARFRFINEQLYTSTGLEALQMFRADKEAFQVYHEGYERQVSKWPVNPVDIIIRQIKDKPGKLVIADFGCGDAKLAASVTHKVHSFDLLAINDRVTSCDMSRTPLPNESVDIAVFCLSLMGTNIGDYIVEANRILKTGGLLKIIEVVSRFKGVSEFIGGVYKRGFQLLNKRDVSQMFYQMDFKKIKSVKKSLSLGAISLKPCIYKKR